MSFVAPTPGVEAPCRCCYCEVLVNWILALLVLGLRPGGVRNDSTVNVAVTYVFDLAFIDPQRTQREKAN